MVVLVSLAALLDAVGVLEVVVVDVDGMQLQRALRLLDEPCETDGIDATRNCDDRVLIAAAAKSSLSSTTISPSSARQFREVSTRRLPSS